MNTIKKSILDAVMTYCDIKIANAQYAFTEIGIVTDTDYVHYTNTINVKGAIYTDVLSVGKIVYPKDSVVYCFVPNNQYNNMFILGKLDASPANIQGGEIHIGETGERNDDGSMNYYFNVDQNGNVEITQGSINLGLNNDGSYNFSVDNDGNMIARDGYFTGDIVGSSITSSDGTFQIDASGNITGANISGSSFSSTNGTFEIDEDGNITGANISGSTLNGDTISGGSISIGNESGSYYFGVDTDGEVDIIGGSINLSADNFVLTDSDGTANFSIDKEGNATFRGSLDAPTGTIAGFSLTDVSMQYHEYGADLGFGYVTMGDGVGSELGLVTYNTTNGTAFVSPGIIEACNLNNRTAVRLNATINSYYTNNSSNFYSDWSGRDASSLKESASIYTDGDIICGASHSPAATRKYIYDNYENSSAGKSVRTARRVYNGGSYSVTTSSANNFIPDTDNAMGCGGGQHRWTSVNATNGTIQTSDKKEKTHISYLSDQDQQENVKDFIMSLKPVKYMWKENGHRIHLGFYAQDVAKDANSTIGDTSLFTAAHYEKDDNGESIDVGYTPDTPDEELSWGLKYQEFIAPMVSMIQMQQKQIDKLQSQIQQLQERNEK